jgi:hypothetical protein
MTFTLVVTFVAGENLIIANVRIPQVIGDDECNLLSGNKKTETNGGSSCSGRMHPDLAAPRLRVTQASLDADEAQPMEAVCLQVHVAGI